MTYSPPSQWQCLLQNLGHWRGSFTQFSPQGEIVRDVPTLVTLDGLDDNQRVHQTVQRFPATGEPQIQSFEYRSLNRSTIFFEQGAFSQGSIQLAPFSSFGAELGFIWGDRRLRLVQLFDPDHHLTQVTLIRERREGTDAPERPPLTVDALLGTWFGEVVTLYPDGRLPDTYPTQLVIRIEGDRLLQQMSAPQFNYRSSAQIEGDRLLFDQGLTSMQVLLLPDGASCNTPLQVPRQQPFFLEAGWLVHPTQRQRMLRRYDANGAWSSLSLITERKVAAGVES